MAGARDRTAQGLLDVLVSSLAGHGVSLDGIVSQCFDGASVLSGERGGLQKLLSVKCERGILYIHCFCHKLHLIVMEIINDIVCDHYALVKSLYDYLKLADIRERYHGLKLKRLLDVRWSGHRDCVNAISREIKQILHCLTECSTSREVKSDHRVAVRVLLMQISKPWFVLVNKFLTEYLDVIHITSKVCQSKTCNIVNALLVIEECQTQISDLAKIYSANKIKHDLKVLKEQYAFDRRPQRGKTIQKSEGFRC